MKIALINENSQAAKNAMIEGVLRKVVEPMGHEVVNYGMYTAEDECQLTYVKAGLLASLLLETGAADYVVTGCGTGEGAMLACNSFPGVLCGHVKLTCSDGNLSIEMSILADVKEEGTAVLPGRLFTELSRKLPGGEVTIRVGENHAASIRCLSSKSNLAGMNPTDYPEMARVSEGTTVRIPQDKLKEMISRVVFAIATEDNRQILTGCLLEVEPTEARLVALDGFRLAIQKAVMPFELPGGKENVRVVIPGRVLNEMSKVLGDTDEYCTLVFDQSRMTASFGTTTLSTVLLTGEYIDYRKILPASFRTTALADRVGVQNAIDRASLMAREGKNNLIRMSFSGDTLAISSNAELGDVLEELETELTGDPIEIAFNAKYITDVIRNITDEKLCMRFNSNVSPCVIAPQEGEDYLYLILPVRVFT